MHGRCDVLHRSLEGRRAWDAFILLSEGMVQAEEGCLI